MLFTIYQASPSHSVSFSHTIGQSSLCMLRTQRSFWNPLGNREVKSVEDANVSRVLNVFPSFRTFASCLGKQTLYMMFGDVCWVMGMDSMGLEIAYPWLR